MEINKQLFEDVLSGKLKGTFVLRNKVHIKTKFLMRSTFELLGFLYKLHYLGVTCAEYTEYGKASCSAGSNFDIIDFIPDINMKENELIIEIPQGKEIDWDESKKQNKIVLKDMQLTYNDICEKLFNDNHYAIAWEGYPIECCSGIYNASNATSAHQLECILAKNKLANVAKYLNNGWKPEEEEFYYFLDIDLSVHIVVDLYPFYNGVSRVLFKSEKLALQAIEILGEETIKLALEPLGI